MSISISSQAHIFLYSVMGGMLMAFIYDVFRIKRKAIKTHGFFVFLEDFIYWIIVAIVMFGVVYYSNDGEIRGFIFLGTALGVITYIVLLSRLVMGVSMLVLKTIYRILKTIWFIITYPFIMLYKIFRGPARLAGKIAKKGFRGARRLGKDRVEAVGMWGRRLRNIRKKI